MTSTEVRRMPDNYYFVSYAREDAAVVHRVVDGIQNQGVTIWLDTMLMPGENWADAIVQAVHRAAGLILFVSQASMDSEWIRRELRIVAQQPESCVIPVILENVADLPEEIRSIQWIDARQLQGEEQVRFIVGELIRAIAHYERQGVRPQVPELDEEALDELAFENVAKARGAEAGPPPAVVAPDAVFIVHGHDLALRDEVEQYIASLGVKPIVLTKLSNTQLSLLQKFLIWSRDVHFAVVLISADDRGASRRQFDPPQGVGVQALQFRARQNVILELGFFYGYLGWEHVFVLYKPPDKVYPNFEEPSDLGGVPFDQVDPDGRWQAILADRLRKAGFNIA
jgi:predicted nucleotide-binding protein